MQKHTRLLMNNNKKNVYIRLLRILFIFLWEDVRDIHDINMHQYTEEQSWEYGMGTHNKTLIVLTV